MNIGIVIPWREQPSRVYAFNYVVKWYAKHFPHAKIYTADKPGDQWNASGSRNLGVRIAEADGCDIIILNDADTIPEKRALKIAIQAAAKTDFIILPYTECGYLDEAGNSSFYSGKDIQDCSYNVYVGGCGGALVFNTKSYWKLGGHDEKFSGWGKEDDAFLRVHKVIHNRPFTQIPGTLFVAGHEPQVRGTDHTSTNEMLFEKYLEVCDKNKILELVHLSSVEDAINFS